MGRDTELEVLRGLLVAAAHGHGGALAVVGEPGIGKTTLLQAAADEAAGMRVVAARGVDAESELGYAVLADVLRPLTDRLDLLVPQQRAIVDGILGLGPAVPADPLGTSAAALALAAAAAESEPLLLVVDDFQWLDVPSRLVLGFVAHRIEGERIALLLGARELPQPLPGIRELHVEKLAEPQARALLAAHSPGIAPAVAAAIVDTAAGNPLALVELTSFLEPEQLSGRVPLPSPLPVNGPVEAAFRDRIEALSPAGRRALVVAAVDDTGQAGVVRRAAAELGIETGALDEAEESGALSLGPPIRFRHPILRSLAHQLPSDRERREVHGALASAIGESDPYRHAWHLGLATLGPDEEVAALLDEAAADARARQQFSSAALATAEAARLTSSADGRARRLVRAASDHQLSGNFPAADACLTEALATTSDGAIRAEAHLARGRAFLALGRWADAVSVLSWEGEQLGDALPDAAATMLAEAALACQPLARIDEGLRLGRRAVEVAERAGPGAQLVAHIAYAQHLALRGESSQVAELLAQARRAAPIDDPMIAGMVLQSEAGQLHVLGEHAEARARVEQLIGGARAAGALGVLPYPLGLLAEIEFRSGHWPQALAAASEGVEIAEQTGQVAWGTFGLQVLARVHGATGQFADAEACATRAQAIAEALWFDGMRFYLPTARAFLALTRGDLEAAVDHGREVEEISRERGLREPAVVLWAPDLIEAYARLDRATAAHRVLERFAGEAEATQRTWALAAAARCHGLLDDDFEPAFAAALGHHERVTMPFERARTELCLGERRRREGRRTDARGPLRSALHTFERLGARPWADRARAELAASGERVRPRDPAVTDELTPHELRVALVVARGATNREAAAELFVSPKTVDFHLRHVYRKLGIRTRAELGRVFAGQAE